MEAVPDSLPRSGQPVLTRLQSCSTSMEDGLWSSAGVRPYRHRSQHQQQQDQHPQPEQPPATVQSYGIGAKSASSKDVSVKQEDDLSFSCRAEQHSTAGQLRQNSASHVAEREGQATVVSSVLRPASSCSPPPLIVGQQSMTASRRHLHLPVARHSLHNFLWDSNRQTMSSVHAPQSSVGSSDPLASFKTDESLSVGVPHFTFYRNSGSKPSASEPSGYGERERARCPASAPQTCPKGSGGGVAMTTSQPSNASELQLYNVLKRANLLQYYDTFIAQGGDDVQQLCEAGEDEFLEIMALVGMAAKPLHVRRLQKALQEWVANPAALEASATAGYPMVPLSGPAPGSISAVVRDTVSMQVHSTQTTSAIVTAPTWTPQAPSRSMSPSDSVPSPSSASLMGDSKEDRSGSPMLQPVLLESQIHAIAMAAQSLSKQLPYFQPKDLNSKKPINREIQNLLSAAESTPNRIEELRKYAAIYGRFDSKRKNDRPMSLHEISVNEAAAQLCLHCPTLLTRREDLFPLARQIVRDSGYQYSKGHSRAAEVVVSAKKGRLDPIFQRHFDTSFKNVKQEYDKEQQEERMSAVAQELASIRQHQEQVKAELVVAKEEQDFAQTQKLKSELASLTSQQLQVLQEHSDLLNRPHSRHNRSRQNNDDRGKGDASGTSSPISDSDHHNLAAATFDSLYAAIRSSKGTLFEEGLRIAQQYGMSDFALELQQLQSQRQAGENSDNGNTVSESVANVLDQPFELKEVKPGFDSGIGDDSLDGEVMPILVADETAREKGSHSRNDVQSVTEVVENGVQTVDTTTLASSSQYKVDKLDLKRKGDNLESSRPPSRRSRSSQIGGVV